MTFSKEWLALREAADHRARNPRLRDEVSSYFAGRAHVTVVDLAGGTGSNLRGLAPFIAAPQSWLLVDHDPVLLAAARETLAAWAALRESRGRRLADVAFRCVDLASAPEATLDERIDLVTSAAFFDLASREWISFFCGEVARRRLPLYAALTYSGQEIWEPPHPADAAALAAFHAHQGRDKGFGRAAGPRAGAALEECLRAHGYRVSTAYSPWRLGEDDRELIMALADGAAQAIGETGRLDPTVVEDWRQARRIAARCEIGHLDLFAAPA
jgi:SAM-dependent methyltransferase